MATSALISAQCVADALDVDLCSCDAKVARQIKRTIKQVSADLERITGRPLCARSNIVECVAPGLHNQIFLTYTPLIAIHSVECLSCGQVFDDVCVDNIKSGILSRCCGWCPCSCGPIHPITKQPAPGFNKKTIRVTYDGGFITEPQTWEKQGPFFKKTPTIPADLEGAVCRMATGRYLLDCRPPGVTAMSNLSASVSFAADADFPSDVQRALEPYTRVCV